MECREATIKCREVTKKWLWGNYEMPWSNDDLAVQKRRSGREEQRNAREETIGQLWRSLLEGTVTVRLFLVQLKTRTSPNDTNIDCTHKLKYRVVCLNTERLPETNWENKTCDGSSCNVYIMNAIAQLSSGIQKRRSFSALMDVFFILSQHAIFLLD